MAAVVGDDTGVSPYLLGLRRGLRTGGGDVIARIDLGGLAVEIVAGEDSLWAILRREGRGGLALRAVFLAGAFTVKKLRPEPGEAARIRVTSAMGEHTVIFKAAPHALERLRVTVRFTPAAPIVFPPGPRDLYPLDGRDDPLGTVGVVEAGQRGMNAGLVYFRMERPQFGNVLYFQNLTALNDYFAATGLKPDDVIGGNWPELGYMPGGTDAECQPLEVGKQVTLSDAILVMRPDCPPDERESARHFLQMLGAAYQMLELPGTEFHDWMDRARRSLHDLENAPEATVRHYGHTYLHPYTAAEYPDSMVQLSVVTAVHRWGKWNNEPHPLEARLAAGLGRFFDAELGTIRRYLPNVGADKDAEAVDSWYLYHPLLNLGILALDGDEKATELFRNSLGYAMKAAHHFKYKWPVQYNIKDFSIITGVAAANGRGQTDVGGIYAWVMLQAFELTGDKTYLDEAREAIDAAIGLRFNLNYQANLTAWGAAACLRLWRITNHDLYLQQSYVYLGSFFHNSIIWDSQIGHAAHYSTFLGVSCLQDAPYMAMYECFDSFAAFERLLADAGPNFEPAARMLVSEYCKYALTRAWYYYPDALPPEAVSPKQRESNGHIDPKLSFPLEDLYPDGQQAGQVGQEVYGAGGALIFAAHSFHSVENAPFVLFSNHFVRALERTGERTIMLALDGTENCVADLSLVRIAGRQLPKACVIAAGGDRMKAAAVSGERIDFRVPANVHLIVSWE